MHLVPPRCVPANREAIAAPRSRDHAELSTRRSPRPSPVEACTALDCRQGHAVGIDGGDVLVVVTDLERRVEILRHWADTASRSRVLVSQARLSPRYGLGRAIVVSPSPPTSPPN